VAARTSSVQLAARLASVPVGRHFVRDQLLDWGLAAAVDDASLAVTELIANAVKHARTPLQVTVVVDGDIEVSVRDRSPQIRRTPGIPEPFAESGRGLRIVAAVSTDWGIATEILGKRLWFRLPLPDASSVDAEVIAIRRGTNTVAADVPREGEAGGTSASLRQSAC
jgi:anti-sigma regulatory factor (Ser/Thr protein kinase)